MRRALCLLLVLLPSPAGACSTPVFRYALERWRPAPYPAQVFHRGPLTAPEQALARRLTAAREANLTAQLIDLSASPPAGGPALARPEGVALPHVQARFPDGPTAGAPVWSGPLNAPGLDGLLDSPARRELARLLTSGESAVWLLLTSGDRRADEAALTLLRRELARLQRELTLPDRTDDEASRLLSDVPLRLSFRVLTLSRSDAREAFLIRTLLSSQPGLGQVTGPIVFPVIGRGRVLAALHGDGLNASRVELWANFLCAACSCRVKELHPGFDLLISFGWDDALGSPPPREELSSRPASATVPIPPGTPPPSAGPAAEETSSSSPPWMWPALAAWAGLVLAAAVWVWRRGAPPSDQSSPSTASTTQHPR